VEGRWLYTRWDQPELVVADEGADQLFRGEDRMPKFVIEREIPGAGKLTPDQLQGVAQKSCGVLREMGPQIQWLESFVTDDKIYCIYIAPDEAAVRKHAEMGGFPANSIAQVRTTIDPTTSE
jgi:hypothetical protein